MNKDCQIVPKKCGRSNWWNTTQTAISNPNRKLKTNPVELQPKCHMQPPRCLFFIVIKTDGIKVATSYIFLKDNWFLHRLICNSWMISKARQRDTFVSCPPPAPYFRAAWKSHYFRFFHYFPFFHHFRSSNTTSCLDIIYGHCSRPCCYCFYLLRGGVAQIATPCFRWIC